MKSIEGRDLLADEFTDSFVVLARAAVEAERVDGTR